MFPQKQRFSFFLLLGFLTLFSLGALCSPPVQVTENAKEPSVQENTDTELGTAEKDASAQDMVVKESGVSEQSNTGDVFHPEKMAGMNRVPQKCYR